MAPLTTFLRTFASKHLAKCKGPLLKQIHSTKSFSSTNSKHVAFSPKLFDNDNDDRLVPAEWKEKFTLPEPELDWDFLLDNNNTDIIDQNIDHRKGVGDVHKVKSLWAEYTKEEEGKRKDTLKDEFLSEALDIPNMSHSKTVIGDESQAVQIDLRGNKKAFDFKPRNVADIAGKGLRMLREDNLTFATGSKTYYLEDDLARLERALISFTVDELTQKGLEMVTVPDLLYSGVIDRCGFKTSSDRSQVYHLHPDSLAGACLAGTAEMSLAGYFMNDVIPLEDLPKVVMAVSRCYRAEAAEKAAERGLYRVHHFTKVEMFGLSANETGAESQSLLDDILNTECELFSKLGLHFRVLDMPSQELGAPAHSKYDVEAWMYGKKLWGEISSCSNCTDFQSRRLNIKYQSPEGHLKHVHTVNGTACAVPRMITSILEQNQEKKKKLAIPDVLVPYMGGKTHLQGAGKNSPYTFIKTLRKI